MPHGGGCRGIEKAKVRKAQTGPDQVEVEFYVATRVRRQKGPAESQAARRIYDTWDALLREFSVVNGDAQNEAFVGDGAVYFRHADQWAPKFKDSLAERINRIPTHDFA